MKPYFAEKSQNVNLFYDSRSELEPNRGYSGVDLMSFGGLQIFSAILKFSQGFEETVEIEVLSLRHFSSGNCLSERRLPQKIPASAPLSR